jgi:hypothetical protein
MNTDFEDSDIDDMFEHSNCDCWKDVCPNEEVVSGETVSLDIYTMCSSGKRFRTCEVLLPYGDDILYQMVKLIVYRYERSIDKCIVNMVNHGVAIILSDRNIQALRDDVQLLRYVSGKCERQQTNSRTLDEIDKGIEFKFPENQLLGGVVKITPQAKKHLEELSLDLGIRPSELFLIAMWNSILTVPEEGYLTSPIPEDLTEFWKHTRDRQRHIRSELKLYPDLRAEFNEIRKKQGENESQ